MVNTDKLLGLMAEQHKTQKDVSENIGISTKTFYLKMKKGVFGSDEIQNMIEYLRIEDPVSIFFAKWVSERVTWTAEYINKA